jgi:hypothetical protein
MSIEERPRDEEELRRADVEDKVKGDTTGLLVNWKEERSKKTSWGGRMEEGRVDGKADGKEVKADVKVR